MTRPYSPLPWRVSKDGQRITARRHGKTITVASGFFARDARYLVAAANHHPRLMDIAMQIRTLLVQLSADDITRLRRDLVQLFNSNFLPDEGDHS